MRILAFNDKVEEGRDFTLGYILHEPFHDNDHIQPFVPQNGHSLMSLVGNSSVSGLEDIRTGRLERFPEKLGVLECVSDDPFHSLNRLALSRSHVYRELRNRHEELVEWGLLKQIGEYYYGAKEV